MLPAPRTLQKQRHGYDHDQCHETADNQVKIRNGSHPGGCGKHDHERRDDVHSRSGGQRGENEMKHVAAADELITRDHCVGNNNGNGAQHARPDIEPQLQQIRHGELCKPPRPPGDEKDHQKARPSARSLPQCHVTVLIRVLATREEAARANPRGEQREHQNGPWQLSPSHEKIGAAVHAQRLHHGGGQQHRHYNRQNDDVDHSG